MILRSDASQSVKCHKVPAQTSKSCIIKESKKDTDMTIDQAIQILSYAKGPYGGTFVAAITGNLIEDIMMEDCIGKTFHRFGDKTIIQGHNLIPLAQWEQREQERRLNDIADLIFD